MFDVTTARLVDSVGPDGTALQATVFQDRTDQGTWYLVPVPRLRIDNGQPAFNLTRRPSPPPCSRPGSASRAPTSSGCRGRHPRRPTGVAREFPDRVLLRDGGALAARPQLGRRQRKRHRARQGRDHRRRRPFPHHLLHDAPGAVGGRQGSELQARRSRLRRRAQLAARGSRIAGTARIGHIVGAMRLQPRVCAAGITGPGAG